MKANLLSAFPASGALLVLFSVLCSLSSRLRRGYGAAGCILLFISAFQLVSVSAFPQGSLTPPGAPAPTMKSLDQIEPRTPISSLPYTINTAGSYYLTKNLSVTSGDGITISVDKVALDLNGFTISSNAASATGTGISPERNAS